MTDISSMSVSGGFSVIKNDELMMGNSRVSTANNNNIKVGNKINE